MNHRTEAPRVASDDSVDAAEQRNTDGRVDHGLPVGTQPAERGRGARVCLSLSLHLSLAGYCRWSTQNTVVCEPGNAGGSPINLLHKPYLSMFNCSFDCDQKEHNRFFAPCPSFTSSFYLIVIQHALHIVLYCKSTELQLPRKHILYLS